MVKPKLEPYTEPACLSDDGKLTLPHRKLSVEFEVVNSKAIGEKVGKFISYTAQAVAESTNVLMKSLERADADSVFLEYMIARSNAAALTDLLRRRDAGDLSEDDALLLARALAKSWEKLPDDYKDRFIQQAVEDESDDQA